MSQEYEYENVRDRVDSSMKPIDSMDDLENFMMKQPCYETHVVKINEIYEEHLMSIMIPGIYEGLRQTFNEAMKYEVKFNDVSKSNPNVEKKNRLQLFQGFLRAIDRNGVQQMRDETDRIKSSSGTADIFDVLVKAVVKSKILLMTYNVDVKRRNLIDTRYHDTVVIHDFVHSCYIESAQIFHNKPELFWQTEDVMVNTNNVVEIHRNIRIAVENAIRKALPMQDIILEFLENPYHQREDIHIYNMVRKCKGNCGNYNMNNTDPGHIINNNNHTLNGGNATYDIINQTMNNELYGGMQSDSHHTTHDTHDTHSSHHTTHNTDSHNVDITNDVSTHSVGGSMSAMSNETELRQLIAGLSDSDSARNGTNNTDDSEEAPVINGVKMIDFDINGSKDASKFYEHKMPKIIKSVEKHQLKHMETANNSINSTASGSNNMSTNAHHSEEGSADMLIDQLLEQQMNDNEVKIEYEFNNSM
jgi:hypothetical protein